MMKKVHNEELNNFYISTKTVKIIKLEDCDEQVCSMESIKMRTRFLLKKNIKERERLVNVGVDERTTLKYILKKQGNRASTGYY